MEKIVVALLTLVMAQASEYQLKAIYLFNFGKFVEWPAGAPASQGNAFSVCVLGTDPFGATLDRTFQGERIGGKSIVARRIMKPQDAANCRILYISTSVGSRLKETLAALDNTNVLTVSDIQNFAKSGGMIQFVLEGTRVRFEINRTRTEAAGLILSSELLKVAAAVR